MKEVSLTKITLAYNAGQINQIEYVSELSEYITRMEMADELIGLNKEELAEMESAKTDLNYVNWGMYDKNSL